MEKRGKKKEDVEELVGGGEVRVLVLGGRVAVVFVVLLCYSCSVGSEVEEAKWERREEFPNPHAFALHIGADQ